MTVTLKETTVGGSKLLMTCLIGLVLKELVLIQLDPFMTTHSKQVSDDYEHTGRGDSWNNMHVSFISFEKLSSVFH